MDFFTFALPTISYHNSFVYVKLYYLQLFTIIVYRLNVHMSYVNSYDIWKFELWANESYTYEQILNYDLLSLNHMLHQSTWSKVH